MKLAPKVEVIVSIDEYGKVPRLLHEISSYNQLNGDMRRTSSLFQFEMFAATGEEMRNYKIHNEVAGLKGR